MSGPSRRFARVLALLSFMALVISVLATAASWALMMFGNDSATAAIVLGLAVAVVSYLLRAWGRWLVGLHPFDERTQP